MLEPELNAKLESIAEQLVMNGLDAKESRAALADEFAALSGQLKPRFKSAAEACIQMADLCRVHPNAPQLAKWTEEVLRILQKELVEGRKDTTYPAFLVQKETGDNVEQEADDSPTESQIRECDPEIFREFIIESREHLEAADVQLMALEGAPKNEEALNAVFRAFHTIKGVAGLLNLAQIQKVAHESENLLDRARKGSLVLAGPAIDVTFEAADTLRKLVQNAAEMFEGRPAPNKAKLDALLKRLVDAQRAGGAEVSAAVEAPAPACGIVFAPASAAPAKASPPESAPVKPQAEKPVTPSAEIHEEPLTAIEVNDEHVPVENKPSSAPVTKAIPMPSAVAPQSPTQEAPASTVTQSGDAGHVREVLKVDAERLDRLVNMIGELVIAESMVSQSPELRGCSTALARHLNLLDKITRELQETGTSLRMVPIRSTFQKMARLVRDLSKKSGKQVEFSMSGEETELDKGVVEKIGDPLMHMIRNSCDHGIESDPADRLKAGKPAAGRVELKAYHRGGNILIEINDDGRGLNKEAILAKARERSLIREGVTLTDREIFNLIFAPGLSTAKTITDVSGRGVGMDVVKRNIEALRGQIDIQSEQGKGTIFTIRLPLTLAIIDGMIVRAGVERYVIPTLSIVRSVRPTPQDIETVLHRGEMLKMQGRLIPVYRLHRLFGIERAQEDLTQGVIVIVEDDGKRAGILADELLGQQQIVIKNLGDSLKNQPGLSGGAIMTDGNVGLILDVSGLIRLAHMDEAKLQTSTELKAAS